MATRSENLPISPKTVERLSIYRRALGRLPEARGYIYSHELARLGGASADQVRRDIMALGAAGSPSRGYHVADLKAQIDRLFSDVSQHKVALVGVGHLGESLIGYFDRRYDRLAIAALFDKDPEKTGRVIFGIRSYPMEELESVVLARGITIAVLALPDASSQEVAERLVASGVTGILNFAPVSLHLPAGVRVEDVDIATALDKLAFFARSGRSPEQER